MSDMQHIPITELTALTTKVAMARGIDNERARLVGQRLAYCLSLKLADSDLLETTLVALAPGQHEAKMIAENNRSLVFTAKGQPTVTGMDQALSTFITSDAKELRVHETRCGALAIPALAPLLKQTNQPASYFFINLEGKERRIDISHEGEVIGVSQPRERTLAWNEVRIHLAPPSADSKAIMQRSDISTFQQACQQLGVPIRRTLWQRMQEIAG